MPAPHQKNKLHPQDQKNLIIFAVMFAVLYLVFDSFILRPYMDRFETYHTEQETKQKEIEEGVRPPDFVSREEAISNDAERITLRNDSLDASVNLQGGRIDDVMLRNYYETLEGKEPVSVMSPMGTKFPRYADFGWVDEQSSKSGLPDKNTNWQLVEQGENYVRLEWDNGQGLLFTRRIELTDKFLIKITQNVTNESGSEKLIFPYALITEHGLPENLFDRWIVHEGPIGFINDRLMERDYDDLPGNPQQTYDSVKGWIGFTEHYWLTSILPEQSSEKTFRFAYTEPENPQAKARYQVDVLGQGTRLGPGETAENTYRLFTGAKELWTLQGYGDEYDVPSLDTAIDFGWFWFLTKPFFHALLFINSFVGFFALTIIIFAGILRACVYPLANTSFKSFAKMKVISPKIMELREQYSDDKQKMQQELVELYKREKVNPAAGCLPILIQIPIFFSLYKVLNNCIEMRHAPGLFWIEDLSAPDPTSVFNLFGLIPFDVPSILMIGAWPCVMLVTLLVQKSMNPPPTDPIQRDMFRVFPFLITFIMSGFAAGLVMYWTFNNIFSMVQQYIIQRSMGLKPKFFQGWFGREIKREDEVRGEANQAVLESEWNETMEDVAEGGHQSRSETYEQEAPKDITPPKPKKKKKK